MKNPTSGKLEIAINSIIAAQHSHRFKLNRHQVQTTGNEYTHLILRGGDKGPNYEQDTIREVIEKMEKKEIINPGIIVDTSHANSGKDPAIQPTILEHVLGYNQELLHVVKGFMVESFLQDGKQDYTKYRSAPELTPGMSITDGCLGWDKTQNLIYAMYDRL